MARVAVAGAALMAVLAPAHAWARPGPDGPPDEEVEEILVQVRLGRYLERTIISYRIGDRALLPMAEFLQLTGMKILEVTDTSTVAQWYPQRTTLKGMSGDSVLWAGTRAFPAARGDLISVGGVLYAATSLLARALDVEIQVDWSELTISVTNPDRLPLIRRLHRAALRRALARRMAPPPPDLIVGPDRSHMQGVVLDYNLLVPSNDPVDGSLYGLALGTNALGGSLKLSGQSASTGDRREVHMAGSWLGVWPTDRYLKQMRVGDGLASGPRSWPFRGVMISNSPYIRPIRFGTSQFQGQVGAGWDVEAYRGSELLGYQNVGPDGSFAFDVPVGYGENPIDVVAYGPYGEIRRFNQTYRVSHRLLQRHRFEYGLSAGACVRTACDGLFNADVRYGLTSRWTVGGGLDRFWRPGSNLDHPYVSVIGNPRNAWTLEAQAALNAYALGRVRYEPSLNLRLEAEHTVFDDQVVDPIITPASQQSRTRLDAMIRPLPGVRSFFLEGRMQRSVRTVGTNTQWLLRSSWQSRNLRLLPFFRLEDNSVFGTNLSSRTFAGMDAVLLARPGSGPLTRSWLQAGVEFESGGRLNRINLDLAKALRTGTRIEAGVRWTNDGLGPVFRFGFSSLLPGARINSSLEVPSEGSVSATQFLQGSMLWNQDSRRVTFNAGPSIERSGVTGLVFLDENANGLHDLEEPGLPGVQIVVGNNVVVTDSSGRYQMWDLLAFDPVLLVIDSTSLASPLWVSSFSSVSLYPEPNTYRTLDLPIIESGVIDGRLVPRSAGMPGLGGIELELIDRATDSRLTVKTFSDGGFYLMGVRPGTYRLTVAEAYAATLGIVADPVEITVLPAMGGAVIENVELGVSRR